MNYSPFDTVKNCCFYLLFIICFWVIVWNYCLFENIKTLNHQLTAKQFTEQQAYERAWLIGYHCGQNCPTYVEASDFEARQQVIMVNSYELYKDTTNPDLSCALDAGKFASGVWNKNTRGGKSAVKR